MNEDSKHELSSNLSLKCKQCKFVKGFSTSKKINKLNEINTRFVYGLKLIGKGLSAEKEAVQHFKLATFTF